MTDINNFNRPELINIIKFYNIKNKFLPFATSRLGLLTKKELKNIITCYDLELPLKNEEPQIEPPIDIIDDEPYIKKCMEEIKEDLKKDKEELEKELEKVPVVVDEVKEPPVVDEIKPVDLFDEVKEPPLDENKPLDLFNEVKMVEQLSTDEDTAFDLFKNSIDIVMYNTNNIEIVRIDNNNNIYDYINKHHEQLDNDALKNVLKMLLHVSHDLSNKIL